jgi:hypothetical protein
MIILYGRQSQLRVDEQKWRERLRQPSEWSPSGDILALFYSPGLVARLGRKCSPLKYEPKFRSAALQYANEALATLVAKGGIEPPTC